MYSASHTASDQSGDAFDPSQVFIGREQQMDLFDLYLNRWKSLMVAAPLPSNPLTIAPNPNNKIQGLVVLLYGRGGFGKSTLLKRYYEMALEQDWRLEASKIVDWEFAVEGKRAIFNPAPGQQIDASEYFKLLCGQLAYALGKRTDEFREYQKAVEAVRNARREARNVLDSLQKDDPYAWLRKIASDEVVAVLRSVIPGVNLVPGIDIIADGAKEGLDQAIKIGADQANQLYEKLSDRLKERLDDYLEPTLRLGLSLGRDLSIFAKNYPLLIFFDTYEEIDEGDKLLRIVMGAAGARVGWVIAGRDNLWAGLEQIERSPDTEYGYKDIVPSDRGLAIDFNVGGIGGFTISDISEYFSHVRKQVPTKPPLPIVTREGAARVLKVTRGVPLAVKIAAGIYVETADLEIVTEKTENKRTIIDRMVRRYLLHTRADQAERARLYGLALLRHADESRSIAAALGLTPEQARTGYEAELSRLQRRYSFIFSEKMQPSLHQEVRHFLRLWLLERRNQPEIITINERLKEAHETALKELEERGRYSSLRERLEEDEWVGIYLDLVEQQFWLDPTEGVRYGLPFMFAAAIYRREASQEAAEIGEFFQANLKQPSSNWWHWAIQSLIYASSRNLSDEELAGLEELMRLASQRCPTFFPPLPDYRKELEAAVWWRLGEAYQGKDDKKALEWYEKALTRLGQQTDLREAAAVTYNARDVKLSEEKKYAECIHLLDRAVELKPDFVVAYHNRGSAYANLSKYEQAIADYDRAIELDPKLAAIYHNRGNAYANLSKYERAIADYNRAIELDPTNALYYNSRANVYHNNFKEYQRAIADYNRAIELDPTNTLYYNNRGNLYFRLQEYERAIADYDRAIELDPQDAIAYNRRGSVYANLTKYEQAIADYDRAIELDPKNADFYNNRGIAYRYLHENERAIDDCDRAIELDPKNAWAYGNRGNAYANLTKYEQAIEQAIANYNQIIELDPTNVSAPWMAEWAGMGKERPGIEMAQRLEEIAVIDQQHYIARVCRGVALGLRGKLKDGLGELDQAIPLEPEEWDAYFWKGMLCAYYYRRRYQKAIEAIQKALEIGLPLILLRPLYWLEKDRPGFFEQYAKPVLEKYGV